VGFLLCFFVSGFGGVISAQAYKFPALDPLVAEHGPAQFGSEGYAFPSAAPSEWTWHKTADGQHPDGTEQAMLWLMNRARQNPAAEGVWPATSNEPDVAGGRTFFQVNLTLTWMATARLMCCGATLRQGWCTCGA
jgi:hypothetical protein